MCKKLFLFLSFIAANVLFSQNVVIRGLANKMYHGKIISAYTYDDLITYTRVKLASDTIDDKGAFELGFETDQPTKVEVRIGSLIGNMYVVPKYYYGITFPKPDSLYDINPNAEYPVELGFIIQNKNDTMEMNSLIIDFNRQFRRFEVMNYQYLMAKKYFYNKLDSFQLQCFERYKNVKEPFFKTWMEYTFAELNDNTLRNRGLLANRYLLNRPILYDSYEYMSFFNSFFRLFMQQEASTKKGAAIIDIINENSDFTMLFQTMKKNQLLQNDTLCELVTIKGLYELYFVPDFKRDNVLKMIEQAGRQTTIPRHKKIIENIIKSIYRLNPGSPAPNFNLKNKKGEPVSLTDFKGKYVYLDFMASWCVPCLQELKEIADLKKKYGDKVVFISISVDADENAYKKFLEKNPKYDWVFLHYGSDKGVKERYNINALPSYFFINKEGLLVLSPAISPSQGFERKLEEMFNAKKNNKGPMDH